MRRYTDEQLSRILSAHEAGSLKRTGGYVDSDHGPEAVKACINQAAYPGCYYKSEAYCRNPTAAYWFDTLYDPLWTADELLHRIESVTK